MGWRAEISKGRGNGRGLADKQSGRPGGKKKSASNKFTRTASSSTTELLTDSEVVALITLPGLRTDVTDELFREVTRSVPFLHGKELGFVELVAPQMEFVRLEKDELVIQEGESGKDAGLFFVLTVRADPHGLRVLWYCEIRFNRSLLCLVLLLLLLLLAAGCLPQPLLTS